MNAHLLCKKLLFGFDISVIMKRARVLYSHVIFYKKKPTICCHRKHGLNGTIDSFKFNFAIEFSFM
jgi:hypothetical protein